MGGRAVSWTTSPASFAPSESQARFGAAESAGTGGVNVWFHGFEDGIWTALRQSLPRRVSAPYATGYDVTCIHRRLET
jgi:hypothetical protein